MLPYATHKLRKQLPYEYKPMGGLEKRKANQDRPIFLASTMFLTLFTIFTYFGKFKNVGIDSS
jgi:hypothetical protein